MYCLILKAGKFKTTMARVPYNKLIANLARAILGTLAVGSFLYGPCCSRALVPQPWASIPQYGPCARLVRGCQFTRVAQFCR